MQASEPGLNDVRAQHPEQNLLLRALPAEEYGRLSVHFQLVVLEVKQVISEPNQPITDVYFPRRGMISLLAVDRGGGAVEVGTIGNEGMTGLPIFHGIDSTPHRCVTQVAGAAVCISAADFRSALPELSVLSALLHRYTVSAFNDAAQSAACNRLHSVEKRCARWLLMTDDRVEGSEFLLTQEFLAYMLGTPRPAVSVACNRLQRTGLIQYSRARIRVLDRVGLEAVSCDCYRITRSSRDAVFAIPEPG